jgi:hypothetical protein
LLFTVNRVISEEFEMTWLIMKGVTGQAGISEQSKFFAVIV